MLIINCEEAGVLTGLIYKPWEFLVIFCFRNTGIKLRRTFDCFTKYFDQPFTDNMIIIGRNNSCLETMNALIILIKKI